MCITGGRGQNLCSFKQPIIVTVCCLGLDRICHHIFEHCWHNKDRYEHKVDVVNPELKVIKPHLHYMTKFKILNGKEIATYPYIAILEHNPIAVATQDVHGCHPHNLILNPSFQGAGLR